jgi:hypothetical protein
VHTVGRGIAGGEDGNHDFFLFLSSHSLLFCFYTLVARLFLFCFFFLQKPWEYAVGVLWFSSGVCEGVTLINSCFMFLCYDSCTARSTGFLRAIRCGALYVRRNV